MQKRAQLTIFIIAAIFLVGIVFLFFAFQQGLLSQQSLSPDAEKIYSFVQNCIEHEGAETIYQIGQNGGYFFPPNLSTNSGVAIYSKDGKNYMPSKEQVENEISFFMNQKLFFCTKNFVDFPDLDISQQEISTKTTIQDESILFNVDYPITVIKGTDKTLIKNFKYEVPVRMGTVYNFVYEFSRNQTSDGICLSCMLEISERNDLHVEMMDYDETTTLFLFRDKNSKINDEDFVWIFANEYGVESI